MIHTNWQAGNWWQLLVVGTFILLATMRAAGEEWWTKPWDSKVSPAIGVEPERRSKESWYLSSVNDQGGTPEKDNQRDIAKSLGRVRKFYAQTTHRLNELRTIGEVLAQDGPVARTIREATPKFDQAVEVLKEAIDLQKKGEIGAARKRIDEALKLLAEGESLVETKIALTQAALRGRHLRNAAQYLGKAEPLAGDIGRDEQLMLDEAERLTANLTAACRGVDAQIRTLRGQLPRIKDAQIRRQCHDLLNFYEYLLKCVSKDGDRTEIYDGETYLRDSEVSNLALGAVSSVARRVGDLRIKLRRLSTAISAATGKPVSHRVADRLAAAHGFPLDDLDFFSRSKFGIVRSYRFADSDPWTWEFNYTPFEAEAVSIAGRWAFQIDPRFEGDGKGWHRADFDDSGWRNIFAPNAWERQGVSDWNPIDNFKAAWKRVHGEELNYRPRGRRFEHTPEHRHYNGMAWYRKTVLVPGSWKGSDVIIESGGTGGRFRIWVNGEPAGKKWQTGRKLRIPAAAVKFGQPNTLAIACFDESRNGGFVDGNLWLVRDGGLATWRRTPMGISWATEESFGQGGNTVRYSTIVSSATPACLISTDSKTVQLWGWSMKGYSVPANATYATSEGVRAVALSSDVNLVSGRGMAANWLLLTSAPGKSGHGRPLLVVFTKRPRRVRWQSKKLQEGLVAEFDEAAGAIALVHPGRLGGDPNSLVQSAKHWSRAVLSYPEHASEFWTVDTARKNLPFEVMGKFSLVYNYHVLRDEWGTKPLETAPLPPLACYALDYRYPGFGSGQWKDLGVPMQYEAYAKCSHRSAVGTNTVTYAAPCGDQKEMWKGAGTLFNVEAINLPGSASQPARWGSNNDRMGFAFHMDWDVHLVDGFGLKVKPQDDPQWKRLDQAIEMRRKLGVFTFVLDFSNDQVQVPDSVYYPYTGGYVREHPECIEGLAEFWAAMAERYKDISPDLLGFNYFNEPCTIDAETYNTLIQRITEAVRKVDKHKWITIDFGDGWANADRVFATKPLKDPKVSYNYHLYYWHLWRDMYEGQPERFFPQYAPSSPLDWRNTEDNYVHDIEDTFLYQTVHHVPVWCGEFGGSVNSPNQEMLLWAEEYIGIMERLGHGWSWWNWNGKSYARTGLQDGDLISPVVLILKHYMHRRSAF